MRAGKVVLVDVARRAALFQAQLKRANNPWVSNAGLVTVENWMGWGGALAGELVAYLPSGEVAWKKRYKANLYGSAQSEDGTRLFVSTCNSDHAPHSGRTWLLDSATGEVIWVRDGFGQVRFDGNALVIGLNGDGPARDNRFFPLLPDGTEPAEYRRARDEEDQRQNRDKPWWVLGKVEVALKEGTIGIADLVPLMDGMERANPDLDSRSRARCWRFRGDIEERLGRPERAYECWTRALELDPKVGVKQKHAALGKRLAQART